MNHLGYFDHSRFLAMIRTKAGDTPVRALGEEIGISASTVSRLLRGEVPNLETFFEVCGWLDVSPALFYTREAAVACPECKRLRSVLAQISKQAIAAIVE